VVVEVLVILGIQLQHQINDVINSMCYRTYTYWKKRS